MVHHTIEIGDHLQRFFSCRKQSKKVPSTNFLLTLLNLHAAGELSIKGIIASHDSRDRRCSSDASRTGVSDINPNNHGGLLLRPRHALLVQLVAKDDKEIVKYNRDSTKRLYLLHSTELH